MPAVNIYPRHTNPAALKSGLVLQSGTDIGTNDFGMEDATLKFLCLNEHRRRFKQKRGTPCDRFPAGDDLTTRVLKEFATLGCQTSKFTRGGGDGIGLMEIACQGATFDILDGVYPDYDPDGAANPGDDILKPARGTVLTTTSVTFKFRRTDGTYTLLIGPVVDTDSIFSATLALGQDTVTVPGIPINGLPVYVHAIFRLPGHTGQIMDSEGHYIYKTTLTPGPGPDDLSGKPFGPITTPYGSTSVTQKSAAIPVKFNDGAGNVTGQIDINVDYQSIDLHFEYMARDYSPRPRFLQASYVRDPVTGLFTVDQDGRSLELLIDKTSANKSGTIALTEDTTAARRDLVNFPTGNWRKLVSYIGTGARNDQTPAGPYWHVLETISIEMVPSFPDGNIPESAL